MMVVRTARLRWIGAALLSVLLLGACGGGSIQAPQLMSGSVAVGGPVIAAAVQLRCADGSVFNTTTNYFGTWQVLVSTQPLPCALQASGGFANGAVNSTAYHSVALSFGNTNITPLTSLVLARLLGSAPQAWFNAPNFSVVTPGALQAAQDATANALGLTTALRGANPLTEAFLPDVSFYLDGVLIAIASTLSNSAVNKTYAALLSAASSGDFSGFASFAATFATEYAALYAP